MPDVCCTITARQLVNIISNTLSLVDPRLSNHGVRVANLVHPVLRRSGRYTDGQMRDICLAALVHDIGAFRTEEVDKIIHFETEDVWAHSIFGAVFLRELSPLARLAPAVFFHHADVKWLERLHPSYREIAQMIHIADRADVLLLSGERLEPATFSRFFESHRDTLFRGELIDLARDAFFAPDREQTDFRDLLPGESFSPEDTEAYLNMIALSIDFRSPQTATHTLAVASIAKTMAELMEMSDPEIARLSLGAMLHDLGKQGTPLSILESHGRLDEREMAIMKRHVVLSNDILVGNVDNDIRLIAVRHHEKMDGSGYPDGLTAESLTRPQRLLAVADILSALMGTRSYKAAFPKERVLEIINSEKARGKLDPTVVDCANANYERIREVVEDTSDAAFRLYDRIRSKYDLYRNKVEGKEASDTYIIPEPLRW